MTDEHVYVVVYSLAVNLFSRLKKDVKKVLKNGCLAKPCIVRAEYECSTQDNIPAKPFIPSIRHIEYSRNISYLRFYLIK